MTPAELRQKIRAMERKQGRFENELGLVSYSGDAFQLTDAQADALVRAFELDVIEGVLRRFRGVATSAEFCSVRRQLEADLAKERSDG